MRKLSLLLLSGLVLAPLGGLTAQTQAQTPTGQTGQTGQTGGGTLTGQVLQASGRIYGTITSSTTGRPISKMRVRVRDVATGTGGPVLYQKDTNNSGDFDFPGVPLGSYVLECVDGNKVLGTSAARLSTPSEAIDKDMACTTDVVFWKTKKGGALAGLGAAVLAIGGTAIVTKNDASPSR